MARVMLRLSLLNVLYGDVLVHSKLLAANIHVKLLPLDTCFYFFEVVELLNRLHVQVWRDHFLRLEIALDCAEIHTRA